MDMHTNRIGRGFWTLLNAGMLIVGYLILHESVPFVQRNTTGYPPFAALTKYLQPAMDTCSTDALLAELAGDSAATIVAPVQAAPEPDTPPPYLGGEKLLRFLASLNKLEKSADRKVRIAYFGDSFIEGDLVTQSLRNDLQERFGGEGVGFVPITSPAAGFRKTIRQTASKDWQRHSFLQENPTSYDFGISGELFLGPENTEPDATSLWVRYEGQETYPKTRNFQRVKLFYGKPETPTTYPYMVRTMGDKSDTLRLDPSGPVNQLLLAQGKAEEIRLDFATDPQLPIYGLSFESTQGLHLDNFASRGNSGMNLINLTPTILQRFNRHFNYDLVVLHYGLNVISPGRTSYNNYEKAMKRVIEHFKENLPGADILLISVSDKSYKIDGEMKTDPCVPLLVESQKRIASETGVAFLNLYEKMGGANSMVRWVEQEPALAHHDYTHPNRRGAEKVSQIIGNFLMREYEVFVEAEQTNPHPHTDPKNRLHTSRD